MNDKKITTMLYQSSKCRYYSIFLAVLFTTSCTKQLEVPPPKTGISGENVFTSDETAAATLTGIYGKMSANYFPDGGITSVPLLTGLSSDEFGLFTGTSNTTYIQYYKNSLSSNTIPYTADFWSSFYPYIYFANSAIERLNKSTYLTPAVKAQLLGEAKFFRAFCYFYLLNLYGDVPLVTITDYKQTSVIGRTSVADVYKFMISELKDAQSLLSEDYVDASATNLTNERTRPNKWSATALLARMYLFTGKWNEAISECNSIIDNKRLFELLSDVNSVFHANSREAIWQLQPVLAGYNTQEARIYIIPPTGPSDLNPIVISRSLLKSFESGDLRRINWIDSIKINSTTYHYLYKYKVNTPGSPVSEYSTILRLSEVYLIRAEAKAQIGDLTGSSVDLNTIRNRSGLQNTTITTKSGLLTAIFNERRVELFGEWGHRWFDLKRSGEIDQAMDFAAEEKGSKWVSTQQLYPITSKELLNNSKLVQNPGY